jgi:biopolymer transport protein ExbB
MRALVILTILLVWTASAPAQDDPSGSPSLDALLQRVQQGGVRQAQELRDREARFRADRDQQRALLQETQQNISTAERRSEQLETTFDKNEIRLTDATEQLDRRLGAFKELFGVLQQIAGDTHGMLQNSLTSSQLTGRGEFLLDLNVKLDSPSSLPTIAEIEHLWFLLQQEMTESGKVVRFTAPVIGKNGEEKQADVVRVGTFNAVTPGAYLQYSPETGRLSELGRQPQGRYRKTTQALFEAKSSSVPFGIDPTRGQILLTYLDRPGLRERIQQGGLIGYVILLLGGLGLLLALERMTRLHLIGRRVDGQLESQELRPDNPLGRVLQVAQVNGQADVETLELKLAEAVLKETPPLTRAILLLKIIGVVAPLLGLLGTVTGMIVTFQSITLFGTGDPKLMAGGISQALVTTVLGLLVAIPMVLLHSMVAGRSKGILHVLQEQSAGIVAERSQRGSSA